MSRLLRASARPHSAPLFEQYGYGLNISTCSCCILRAMVMDMDMDMDMKGALP